MRIVVTGAHGFLGWHTSVRLSAVTDHEVVRVGRSNWNQLSELATSADAIIHIAGINRAAEEEVRDGNIRLAEDVATAVKRSGRQPAIVYANSTQAESNTAYGTGKREAARVLARAAATAGSTFTDSVLPNLFGEHGLPHYNSFVATFAHKVALGEDPDVQDRDVELLHVQQAAQVLIEALDAPCATLRPRGTLTTVGTVLQSLQEQFSCYQQGEIPALTSRLDVDLFNTLRAAVFPHHYPIPLARHSDERGSLVETVRAHGSEGQTFFSTSKPGVTRGQHFHLRKVERFVVVDGEARISLRRMLTDELISFDVSGEEPVIVDMPTLWAHNIVNTGDRELTTMFWTNELFDASNPDTYAEEV